MSWTLPGVGRITSPYGPRSLAGAIGSFHYGTDLGTKRTAVYAAAAGVVRTIWQTAPGAWVLDIRHADEGGRQIRTRYIHMYRDEITVKGGQHVTAGQQVGTSGASGTSAAHLHFEVLVDGVNVDPEPFMAARGVTLGVTTVTNPGGGTPTTPTTPPTTAPTPITPAWEDDMALSEDARKQIRLDVLEQVTKAIRAEVTSDAFVDRVAAAVLAAKVSDDTGTLAQTVRDSRRITRRLEAAWRKLVGLPADPTKES